MDRYQQIVVGDDCSKYPEYTELVAAIVTAAYDTGNPFDVPFKLPYVWVPLSGRPNPNYTTACSTQNAKCAWLPWHHCPLKDQILIHMIEDGIIISRQVDEELSYTGPADHTKTRSYTLNPWVQRPQILETADTKPWIWYWIYSHLEDHHDSCTNYWFLEQLRGPNSSAKQALKEYVATQRLKLLPNGEYYNSEVTRQLVITQQLREEFLIVEMNYPDDMFSVTSTDGGWSLRCDDCPGETHDVVYDPSGRSSLERTHLLERKHINAVLFRMQQTDRLLKDTKANNFRLEGFKTANPNGPIHPDFWVDMVEFPSAAPMAQNNMLVLQKPKSHMTLPEYFALPYRSAAHLTSPLGDGNWYKSLNAMVQGTLYKVVQNFGISRWDLWYAFGHGIVRSRVALLAIGKVQRARPTTLQEVVVEARRIRQTRCLDHANSVRNESSTFIYKDIQKATNNLCLAAFSNADRTRLGSDFPQAPEVLPANAQPSRLGSLLHTLGDVVDLTQDGAPVANDNAQRDDNEMNNGDNEDQSQSYYEELTVSLGFPPASPMITAQGVETPIFDSLESQYFPLFQTPTMHDETLEISTEPERTSIAPDRAAFGSDGEDMISPDNPACATKEPVTPNVPIFRHPTPGKEPSDETPNHSLRACALQASSHDTTSKRPRSPSPDSNAELEHFRREREKRRKLDEHDEAIKHFKTELQSIGEWNVKLFDEFNGHQLQIENANTDTATQFKQFESKFEVLTRSAKGIEPLQQEFQALQNNHQDLRLDIDATKAKIEDQNESHLKSITDLRKDVITSNQTLADHDTELGQSRQSATTTQTQVGALEEKLGRLDANYASLNDCVALCVEANQKTGSISTATKDLVIEFEQKVAQSAEDLESLTKAISSMRVGVKDLEKYYDDKLFTLENEKILNLENGFINTKDVLEMLSSKSTALADKIEALEQTSHQGVENMNEIRSLNTDYSKFKLLTEKNNEKTRESLDELLSSRLQHSKTLVAIKNELEEALALLNTHHQEHEQSIKDLSELHRILRDKNDSGITRVESLKDDIEMLSAKNAALTSKLEVLEKSSGTKVDNIEEIQQLKARQVASEALADKNKETCSSISTLERKNLRTIASMEKAQRFVSLENKSRHEGHDQSIQALDDFGKIDHKRLSDLEADKNKMKIKTRKLEDQIMILQRDKKEMDANMNQLKARLDNQQDQKPYIKQLAEPSRKQVEETDDVPSAAVVSMFKKFQNQSDTNNQALADQKIDSSKLKAENANLKADLIDMKAILIDMQAILIDMQAKQAAHDTSITELGLKNTNRVEQCQYNKLDIQKTVDKERRARESESGKMLFRIANAEEDIEKMKGVENGTQKGKKGRG